MLDNIRIEITRSLITERQLPDRQITKFIGNEASAGLSIHTQNGAYRHVLARITVQPSLITWKSVDESTAADLWNDVVLFFWKNGSEWLKELNEVSLLDAISSS